MKSANCAEFPWIAAPSTANNELFARGVRSWLISTLGNDGTGSQVREQVLTFTTPRELEVYRAAAKTCAGQLEASENGVPTQWAFTAAPGDESRMAVAENQIVFVRFLNFKGSAQDMQNIVEKATERATGLR